MPNFNLTLTTEEVKTLQGILEQHITCSAQEYLTGYEQEILTKVTLVQLVDDGCMSKREAAYIRDANYPPPDENGPAF